MMAKNKTIKNRGSKTCGYGSKKKHRGAGSRGGVGNAGKEDHKRLMFRKKGIEMGARGFKTMKDRHLKAEVRSINLGDLERLAGDKKEIILAEFGYDKVLGRGTLKRPLKVIAKSFSGRAQEKIEAAGGKVE